jgi:hypothetical protein
MMRVCWIGVAHGDKCRAQVTDAQLELEQLKSKLSLLEVESTRSESRATTAEERNRLLQKELHSSLDAHKQRIEELARDFERKLSEKETELQFRAGECRVLAEEAALLRAKNEALGAKMRQSQADLEKRVIKSLRSTMAEVRAGSGGAGAAGEDP